MRRHQLGWLRRHTSDVTSRPTRGHLRHDNGHKTRVAPKRMLTLTGPKTPPTREGYPSLFPRWALIICSAGPVWAQKGVIHSGVCNKSWPGFSLIGSFLEGPKKKKREREHGSCTHTMS